jgi:hypothetical protein
MINLPFQQNSFTGDPRDIIKSAIESFKELDVKSLTIGKTLCFTTCQEYEAYVSVYCPKYDNTLKIWFKQEESLLQGGKAVDAGYSPHLYNNYKELLIAIRLGIKELERGEDPDSDED